MSQNKRKPETNDLLPKSSTKNKVRILRQDAPTNSLVDAGFEKHITAYLDEGWKIGGVASSGFILFVIMVKEGKPNE